MATPIPNPPDALLLLTSRCPHCPTVLEGLSQLVKAGKIGRLEAINIEVHPDAARRHGARSVPWLRIGEFELEGLHSPAELETWAQRAASPDGLVEGYAELLKNGQLGRVTGAIRKHPQHLDALLRLAGDPDSDLTVRIGVSAVLEDLQGDSVLQAALPKLLELSRHSDPAIRADAAHFLMLSGLPEAIERLQAMTGDDTPSVRELAADELEELRAAQGGDTP